MENELEKKEAERKHAETAAMESNAMLKLTLEAAGMFAWDLNNQTGEVIEDDRWLAILGYQPGEIEISLQNIDYFMHPDDLPRIMQAVTDHLERKTEQYNIEYRLRNKAGDWIWVQDRGKLVSRDAEGKPWRTIGVHLDINERKQAEAKLQRLNRELQAISHCNQTLIRAEDEKTLLKDICRIICDKAGYRMAWAGYKGNDASQSVFPAAWAGFENGYLKKAHFTWADTGNECGAIGTAIRKGETVYIQEFMTDPASSLWIQHALQCGYRSCIALPLKDEKSEVFGALNIYSSDSNAFTTEEIKLLEDLAGDLAFGISVLRISKERRHIEEELQSRNSLLLAQEDELRKALDWHHAVFEGSRDAIMISDADGRILDANTAAVTLTGYPKEELLTMRESDLSRYNDPESFSRLLLRIISGEYLLEEKKFTVRDSREIDVETGHHRIIIDGMPYIHTIARDITSRKKLESQFAQAQKMEAIGILAGGVAHDFNNLLNVINGYCELILDDLPENDPRRNDLEQIGQAGKRAASLTSQLLAFSRKQIMQQEVLDLNVSVTQMDKLLRRLIGEDIELSLITCPDLGFINADPGQMQQIIMNLAVNARDAMPHGGKLIIETSNTIVDDAYVREHPAVKAGPYVMLAISDNGSGMSEEIQAHLFEPFFTTKEKGKGTGLGLSTVYGIVKQNSGFIWVYSERGKGTTFKIYFPRMENRTAAAAEEDKTEKRLHGSETLLVVEDDPSVQALTGRILQEQGYTVFTASNGIKALDIAKKYAGEINLLITDVIMPEMGGRELAVQLATIKPGIKVLYVSGYTDDAILRYGILDKDAAFLQKPFTTESLARKVRMALDAS